MKRGSITLAVDAVIAACLLSACGRFGPSDPPPTPAPSELACHPPASQTDDLPANLSTTPAEFSTDGSGLYVTVSGFEHTQAFDPKVGSSAIYIGHASEPPSYDRQRDVVTNSLRQLEAQENQPAELGLPAGRYWLWASNAPELRLWGCSPGSVTDAVGGGGG